jgi:hypothetical protein
MKNEKKSHLIVDSLCKTMSSSSAPSSAAPDKEAFQNYLEKSGLLDTLTQRE